ncbi:SusD/RagB family nutrient-binding outer membrane lipoprotein [Aureispira sp. CCB-E]|uniref:SusD/RagB family nutrient-binding outer membrane lipoprotein n=1 Tax=Aureispira sp. CCB-E TaxID=3051121 RepID=UPI002868B534|nr:SusD/RagB family nutrient-binding outer membrane lipoprotein [Aureispira sp. CCB-E]WMX13018.1 SusD/RagB family nutrient-binding outer membrane lipoprotein [Aureispira sp. CCB-E]
MIRIKSFHLIILMLILVGFSSCEQYFGDTNVDPDSPSSVTPPVILPAAQLRLAYVVGGDASRFSSIFTQHVDGVTRQFSVIQNYGLQPTDVDALWSQNLYSGILQEINQLKISANGNPHYTGIAQVLEAYTIMLTTDLFGDVPYSQALQGRENLQPMFDSQESIYTSIQNLLDESITNFAATNNGLVPGPDDVIYGGDISLWTKFAYSLKARAHLHLGLVDQSNYTKALTALTNGFSSWEDDADLKFGTAATANAPWFQYNNERNDIAVGANYVSLMNSLNDTVRGKILGAPLTVPHPIFVPDQAQPLMTYTELKFIEAECRMKTEGATAATHQAYLDGISSSFAELGVSGDYPAYVAQGAVDPGQATLSMNEIMTQKYIALYTDVEVFNDWRRTGIPSLTPNSGSQIPVRLPYPNDEVNYNSNCPVGVTLFDKVWWDMN